MSEDLNVPKALSGTGSWLDDRFHGARGLRVFMRKVFPDHWSFMLGEIALWSFVILLLTGTFLSLFFVPSTSDVIFVKERFSCACSTAALRDTAWGPETIRTRNGGPSAAIRCVGSSFSTAACGAGGPACAMCA